LNTNVVPNGPGNEQFRSDKLLIAASSKIVMMSPSGMTGSILYQKAMDRLDVTFRRGSTKYWLYVLINPTQFERIPNGPYENDMGIMGEALRGPEIPVASNR
jgi:hypothetical protein